MRGDVAADVLQGEARVLDLADRMRQSGGCTPHRLFHECVSAFSRGEVAFDDVPTLYRHAMLHAGGITPRDRPRFHLCPVCSASLGMPAPATGDLLASLRRWEELNAERDRLRVEIAEVARELERRAAALNREGSFARLYGQDPDGRVRFYVRGMSQRTFSLEELAGGA